jgi:hypothetical protein
MRLCMTTGPGSSVRLGRTDLRGSIQRSAPIAGARTRCLETPVAAFRETSVGIAPSEMDGRKRAAHSATTTTVDTTMSTPIEVKHVMRGADIVNLASRNL